MTEFAKWKTIGYAVAIFVTGGISGGALGVYETKSQLLAPPVVDQGPQEIAPRIMSRLRERLDLTPDQTGTINPIIQSTAADLSSIHRDTDSRISEVYDGFYSKVAAVLTPDQNIKLDQMKKERGDMMQRRWGADGGRRHPGGPGGQHRDESPHEGQPYNGPIIGPSAP